VKQLLQKYAEAVKEWDKTHRLVGKVSVEQLLKQSIAALTPMLSSHKGELLLDVGAGSGLMGVAWLALDATNKTLFIEPKAKSHSFILSSLSSLPDLVGGRWSLLPKRIEDVSRETVYSKGSTRPFAVARAFSGNLSLKEAWDQSPLKDIPLYSFSTQLADSGKATYLLELIESLKETE